MTQPNDPIDPNLNTPQYSGSTPAAPQAGYSNVPQKSNGPALAALILGIIALIAMIFIPVALVAGIAAIVLGIIGLRRAKTMAPGTGRRGMAIAGIVMGAISTVVALLLAVALGASVFGLLDSEEVKACEHLKDDTQAFEQCVRNNLEDSAEGSSQ